LARVVFWEFFFVGANFWAAAVLMVCGAVSVGAVANVCFFKVVQSVSPHQVDATIGMMEAFGNGVAFALPLAFSVFANVARINILLVALSVAAGGFALVLYFMQKWEK
jgi:nitrate/nitrite transporter NarK